MSRTLRLWIVLWSAFWTAAMPLLLLYLLWRSRRAPHYRAHLLERFGCYQPWSSGAVWLHAVSLGELRSAVPLIQALLERGERVVTTHFTPAGRGEAERVFAAEIAAGRLRAVWVPMETGWAYRGFLRAFRPAYGLVMEIEIWPQMIASAWAARVPLLMCNAQYPSLSLARDSAHLPLRQALMRGFAGALVKSELQRQRFVSIGLGNIAVTGELRFEQPVPAQLVAAGTAARRWLGAQNRPVICIASAVEGEDPIYLQAIQALRAQALARGGVPPLVVYVPRRPERFDEVAALLEGAGLHLLRRSRLGGGFESQHWGAPPAHPPDLLLGDSLGEMYAYLAMADQVVVGGGFTPSGAHNISEALVLGKPVLTGPDVHTIEYPFLEAVAAGVARSVPDGAALAQALLAGFSPSPAAIEAFLRDHAGATQRTLQALPELLSRSAAPPRR
ncbi:MAG: glycosyltransferase N-terminal domain-containing protein [Cyanobacteriota bacterium]|nr:glycosyltransferase N-terminal domain-containing protein [Cyanobacteriota bacterium]